MIKLAAASGVIRGRRMKVSCRSGERYDSLLCERVPDPLKAFVIRKRMGPL